MNDYNPLSLPHRDRDGTRKKVQSHFVVREQRDSAIRQEINRQRADTDAKTAKLRALRLAKEETDRQAATLIALDAPAARAKKPRKKFVMG